MANYVGNYIAGIIMKFDASFRQDTDFSINEYYKILSPEFPEFLKKYLSLPLLTRLMGVGLLCGSDWTPLFQNNFYYSRFDHSVATALIAWHFTHDKIQTIAALLHDVSTPAFSHVSDFRKGDALTQTATEDENAAMIHNDTKLCKMLFSDGIKPCDVDDYHKFPVCDNEVPCLSADRLEYMYPSCAALIGSVNLDFVRKSYNDISVLKNEKGETELGFNTPEIASEYFEKTLRVGLLLQQNEDKVALQLMADVLNKALSLSIITEQDLYTLSEEKIISRFDSLVPDEKNSVFIKYYRAFRSMKEIVKSDVSLENHYCVSLKVKKRHINPLVRKGEGAVRICDFYPELEKKRRQFLEYTDSVYGCVPLE